MKKILLIVVDALASQVLMPALGEGKLPHLLALSEAGVLRSECISVFPSITPAATASIVTGQYPCKHHILGAHWYDLANDEVVYYGDDIWVILSQGLGSFFDGLLWKLNHDWLKAESLFQMVERSGLRAACLNYLIYRGDVKHQANVPLWLSLLPGVPFSREIYGPSMMYFGDLVDMDAEQKKATWARHDGPFQRFGFTDDNTADRLIQLAEARALPDFTLAYFPDNDYRSHEVGPETALAVLEHLDSRLGQLIARYGGLEPLLDEYCLVLCGDHSQSDILAGESTAGIRLDEILGDFRIAPAGQAWGPDDQLVISINMRTGHLYLKEPTPAQFEAIIEPILADARVDQVIYRANDFGQDRTGFRIITRERGTLHFWPGDDGANTAVDRYGNAWSWCGNLSTVDGQISADNTLTFPTYPNAFERIAGGLNDKNSGHLWLTARPGYEFCLAVTNIHAGGGSHGSLHALDSTSVLLVAGASKDVVIPSHPRITDVAPLCLSILGLETLV